MSMREQKNASEPSTSAGLSPSGSFLSVPSTSGGFNTASEVAKTIFSRISVPRIGEGAPSTTNSLPNVLSDVSRRMRVSFTLSATCASKLRDLVDSSREQLAQLGIVQGNVGDDSSSSDGDSTSTLLHSSHSTPVPPVSKAQAMLPPTSTKPASSSRKAQNRMPPPKSSPKMPSDTQRKVQQLLNTIHASQQRSESSTTFQSPLPNGIVKVISNLPSVHVNNSISMPKGSPTIFQPNVVASASEPIPHPALPITTMASPTGPFPFASMTKVAFTIKSNPATTLQTPHSPVNIISPSPFLKPTIVPTSIRKLSGRSIADASPLLSNLLKNTEPENEKETPKEMPRETNSNKSIMSTLPPSVVTSSPSPKEPPPAKAVKEKTPRKRKNESSAENAEVKPVKTVTRPRKKKKVEDSKPPMITSTQSIAPASAVYQMALLGPNSTLYHLPTQGKTNELNMASTATLIVLPKSSTSVQFQSTPQQSSPRVSEGASLLSQLVTLPLTNGPKVSRKDSSKVHQQQPMVNGGDHVVIKNSGTTIEKSMEAKSKIPSPKVSTETLPASPLTFNLPITLNGSEKSPVEGLISSNSTTSSAIPLETAPT